jgi:hypothetical protein
MENKMSRNWLGYRTRIKLYRERAIEGFESIGIGGWEPDEYECMTVEEIESMAGELQSAIDSYTSTLESSDDIDTNKRTTLRMG